MSNINIAQPDVTLLLDLDGVIREATCRVRCPTKASRLAGQALERHGRRRRRRECPAHADDAREQGVSAFRQVTQRFPSGLELPMEYTTVLLGGRAGLLAIGKNLQAVAELQSRLIAAQQAMERDYWKLREVETRYRLLFDASNEAVVLVRAADLRIVEANPAAMRALSIEGRSRIAASRNFVQEVAAEDRDAFQAMLLRVREQGKAPGILIHLGSDQKPWLVRASLMSPEPGPVFLLQLGPAGPAQRRQRDRMRSRSTI